MPRALVIRAAGTNCDGEMVRAFALAGAEPTVMHLDALCRDPNRIDDFDLLGFPGGFSYGDDVASGRIFAMRVRERLWPALRRAIERSCPMIGACNGFQVMVQVGLLPGPPAGEPWPTDQPPAQTVALTDNIGGRFVDRWVGMVPETSNCVWTRELAETYRDRPEALQLPVAHGEGRLVVASPRTLVALEQGEGRGHVALRYADNYNGSEGAIAGLCDASGLIFGLMPHPERFLEWNRHPFWTRLSEDARRGDAPGLVMFKSAVEAAARMPV